MPEGRTALIVAGPPGSGKSTLLRRYAETGLPIFGRDAPALGALAVEDYSVAFGDRIRAGGAFDLAELLNRHGRYALPDRIVVHADLFGITGVYRFDVRRPDMLREIRIRRRDALEAVFAHYETVIVSTVLVDCATACRLYTRRLLDGMLRHDLDTSPIVKTDAVRRTIGNSLEVYIRPRTDIYRKCYGSWLTFVAGRATRRHYIGYDRTMNPVVRKSSVFRDYMALRTYG